MTDCDDIQRLIWADEPGHPRVRAHLGTCTDCSAEQRRAVQLMGGLAGLRANVAIPPAHLEQALFALADQSVRSRARQIVEHPRFWRGAAVGAAAAATAAVGVVFARRMLRPDLVV